MYNLEVAAEGQIFYFTNAFNTPYKYIEFLEDLDKKELSYKYIEKWNDWMSSNDTSNIYGQKKHIKPFEFSKDEDINKYILYLINSVKEPFNICSTKYSEHRQLGKSEVNKSFTINKYYSGKYMGPHIDSYGDSKKKTFTILIYINDDYEGGEIEFPNQNIKFKPKSGSLLIFPTNEPFVHQSHEVISGIKYFILGEFFIKEEDNE